MSSEAATVEPEIATTPLDQIPAIVGELRTSFRSGRTRPLSWRVDQLRRMKAMLVEHEEEFLRALAADLGRPSIESWAAETGFLAGDVDYILKRLAKWTKPETVKTPMPQKPGRSRVYREPYGVVLIIAPWNYPVQLVLGPLISAIAAGNCAVIKPSEVSANCSALLGRLLPQYVDTSCIRVVEGAVAETQALLAEQWDYVFFTGNAQVGRIVMEAAARNLTPVTLELGGKSPCIVDENVDLDVAARRIVWGKFFNTGQTCVAPDYVLAHRAVRSRLLETIKKTIRDFYGADPKASPDYGRIVNARHHRRLLALLEGQKVTLGGDAEEGERYLGPTVLEDPAPDSKVMQEEIFGPILPVLEVGSVDEAIEFVNARPKPLALYVFSRDASTQEKVLASTSSGGAAVNDCITHLAVPELPFGGVGPSGMGSYHGRAGFETFSHRKSVLNKATWLDPSLRYPPYTESKRKWMKRIL